MADEKRQIARCVAEEAARCLPLQEAHLGDEHEYASLPLCVIDAVFSIGVKYASTKKVPPRWANAQTPPWPVLRRDAVKEHSICEFLESADRYTDDQLALDVFKNRQLTSTKNGIRKAEAVRQFARALQSAGIDRFADCDDQVRLASAEIAVRDIKGQGSGISFDYFRILIGHPTVKGDRMVCRFVACSAKLEHVTPAVAKQAVIDAAELLKDKYPTLDARVLDYLIWSYESREAAKSRKGCD